MDCTMNYCPRNFRFAKSPSIKVLMYDRIVSFVAVLASALFSAHEPKTSLLKAVMSACENVGEGVGAAVGFAVGEGVGELVGAGVGLRVGEGVGPGVGRSVGEGVGAGVGWRVGSGVGAGVGLLVACGVGEGVG